MQKKCITPLLWVEKSPHATFKKTPIIMKSLFFACLIGSAGLVQATNTYAQTTTVSLHVENQTVGDVLQQIESKTEFSFFYNNRHVDLNRRVSVSMNETNIFKILDAVFEGTDVVYQVVDNRIVLSKRNESLPVVQQSGKKITGTVLDATGMPVIGANVMVKGTTTGTITDMDGKFSLDVPEGATLVVTYIGFANQEIKVGNQTNLSIALKEDAEALDELVVVGYGTQKKVNLTGAVETVTLDILENRPVGSVTEALQGAALGVTVSASTGEPGSNSTVKIRGNSSLNSAGVLVLIDGMPGDMNRVNPQDIENISVLKDAASAAIYGSRAAEGVILITTKTGKTTKTRVEYNGNISFNTPTRIPQSTTAIEHAKLANLAFTNAGLSPMFSEKTLQAISDPSIINIPDGNDWIYTADVDWIDMMMDHSFQQTHNLTVSRSQKHIKYLFSAGWLDQNGMFSEYGPDNYDRFNLRSNISLDIIDEKLSFDSRIAFTRIEKRYVPNYAAWTIPNIVFQQCGPNMPVYDSNGNYARFRMQANPIQVMKEGGKGTDFTNVIEGNFTLAYIPIKDLTLKAVGGVRFRAEDLKDWRRAYGKYGPSGLISEGAGQKGPNSIIMQDDNTRYFSGQLLASYDKSFNLHEFNILGGWSAETEYFKMLKGKRINIVGNELPALNLGSTEGWSNEANETHWALLSGFMRLNYSYDSKYLL